MSCQPESTIFTINEKTMHIRSLSVSHTILSPLSVDTGVYVYVYVQTLCVRYVRTNRMASLLFSPVLAIKAAPLGGFPVAFATALTAATPISGVYTYTYT